MSKIVRRSWPLCVLAGLMLASTAGAEGPAALDPAAALAAAGSPTDSASDRADATSPTPVVERFHAGLLQIMKEAKQLGFQGRIERLTPLMKETFDLEFMASKTVSREWRKLSDEDKARWIDAFTRLTTANYAGRFTGFKGEEFVTLGQQEAARGTEMVLSKIVVPDDKDVQLNYRLRKKDGVWKVIDIYLDGTVSELALRRAEYSSVLKNEGYEQLVATVETKIEDLKAKGMVDG